MARTLILLTLIVLGSASALAGPYSPAGGEPGSTAVPSSSGSIVAWASSFLNLVRGPQDIANPGGPFASAGTGDEALGPADGNSLHAVSLGDGGRITVSFAAALTNGPGADFAVFENSFSATFLELAFVEVSTNGTDFVRFPALSLTQSTTPIGSFGSLDPTDLSNLAGNFAANYGTPFDLAELAGVNPAVDVNHINFVRLIDVVGSLTAGQGTQDSLAHFINDPYPTAFASSGFDLDGVAAIHMIPEPGTLTLAGLAMALLAVGRCQQARRRVSGMR